MKELIFDIDALFKSFADENEIPEDLRPPLRNAFAAGVVAAVGWQSMATSQTPSLPGTILVLKTMMKTVAVEALKFKVLQVMREAETKSRN